MCTIMSDRTNNSHASLSFGRHESSPIPTTELSTASYSDNDAPSHSSGSTRLTDGVMLEVEDLQASRPAFLDRCQAPSLASSYALRISAQAASSLASELT